MFRKTLLLTIGCLAACGLVGAIAGAWLGQSTVRSQDRHEAGVLAARYVERSDELNDEAVRALNQINRFRAPMCSDEDIAHMRGVVIASTYLKSAARIHDRHMMCSSTLGRLAQPTRLADPDLETQAGRRVLLDSAMLGVPGARAMVIEQGDASVVLPRRAYALQVDSRLDYAVVADYGSGRTKFIASGDDIDVNRLTLGSGTSHVINGRTYEVRCSASHTGCILATLRVPSRVLDSPVFLGFTLLGLLAGLGAGFGLSAAVAKSLSIGRELRRAVRAGTLSLVYQPIVRLADKRRVGAEALVRWRDEVGNPVSPDLFISVAEQEGFITEVTRFVFKRVLSEMGAHFPTHPSFQVTVNVSTQDLLDTTFVPFVRQALQVAGVSPRNIGFEITERSTASRAAITPAIQQLRDAGHKVYIDDFGTDYSSLSYLAQLRIDAIKLDRTFTLSLEDGDATVSIAPQIVSMAQALDLELVVEGIEHEHQAAYFRRLAPGALGQGWLFGRPVPGDQLFTGRS